MKDLVERLRSSIGVQLNNEAADHIEALEKANSLLHGFLTNRDDRIEALEAALRLAEDVLSRAPFSTAIWPNGMHPQRGITIIRAALAPACLAEAQRRQEQDR